MIYRDICHRPIASQGAASPVRYERIDLRLQLSLAPRRQPVGSHVTLTPITGEAS